MHRSKRERRSGGRRSDRGLLNRVKVRYRSIRGGTTDTAPDSDTDELVSADEELLGSFDSIQQRSSVITQVT